MDAFLQDIRYAVRTLRRSRMFALVAVLCLALGIGVNTTIFSVVNACLIRPFPFRDPEQLVVLQEQHTRNNGEAGLSWHDLVDWRAQTTAFTDIAAIEGRSLTLANGDEPERLTGGAVTANMFPMLGIAPVLGRQFRAEEDRPGGESVVLLSHGLWERRFASDPSTVGSTIQINGLSHTVIGVMPKGFKFPEDSELWVPLRELEGRSRRDQRGLFALARLRPETPISRARSELAQVSDRLAAEYAENADWRARVVPLRDEFIPEDVRLITLTMMGAVTFVLLIACANVANLMLARATARAREIAIRAALGAGRGRIVRQLLTESVILAVVAGAIGIPLAAWGLRLIDMAIPPANGVPYYIDWSIDRPTLIYTVIISVLTGILFGLAPALDAARGSLQEALRDGARGSGSGVRKSRFRNALVVAEIALSLVLLVGASLFVRSFVTLQTMSGGFDSAPLMTMRFYMPGTAYDSLVPRHQRIEDVVRRVEALPGVQAAFASNLIPTSGGASWTEAIIDGRSATPGEEPPMLYAGVTPRFFETLGVRLLAGRMFTEAEANDSGRVAVVSEQFAKRMWAGNDPIGRRFRFKHDTGGGWFTVIGVSPDIANDDLDQTYVPSAAYVPIRFGLYRGTGLVVRTTGDPAAITPAVRREIHASDPKLAVYNAYTMEDVRRQGFWQYALFGSMFSTFGGIALLLAAIGVYGVISYGVSQRTQEIGVRVALGAQRRDVLRLVVTQGLRLAGIGIAVGIVAAFGVTRVVQSLLFGVSASDPFSFVTIAVFLSVVAAVASWLPARRATAVDPIVALRSE